MNPVQMVENEYESCKRCGICLQKCPILQYEEEMSIAEISKLRDWEKSEVIDRCISCFSCDAFCPNDNHPYELILSNKYKIYQETKKIPGRSEGALPLSKKNFLHYAEKKMDQETLTVLDKWKDNSYKDLSGEKEVILAGCNYQIYPELINNPIFKDTVVIGAKDLCCGEVYFRMSLFNVVEKLSEHIQERYKRMKIKKLIVPCMAGYSMLSNILPNEFGAKFDFEIEYGGEWVLNRLKSGEIPIERKVEKKISVQESCHGKILGDDFMNVPRDILKFIGADIDEMEHSRVNAICCGAADGIRKFNPIDMLKGSFRQIKEARATEAEMLSPYCATCLLMLSSGKLFYPGKLEINHLFALVSYAAGYTELEKPTKRAGQILQGLIPAAIPSILTNKKIDPEKDLPK